MKDQNCREDYSDIVNLGLLDDLADSIFLIDPETSDILYVNRAGYVSLGMTCDEVLYHSVMSLQEDVADLPHWSEIAQVISQSEQPFLFLGRHKRKDGSVFPVEVRTSNIRRGGKRFFLSIARDITCRVMIDEELKGHQHSLWYALNEATDGIWEWNIKSDQLYVSPKLKQMRGYGPQEPIADVNFWKEGIHPDDIEGVLALMEEHIKGNLDRYDARYRLKMRAGHYIWVHDRGKISEYGPGGEPLVAVGMVQNITEQVHLQQRLENQASTDELTGAYNRRVCQEVIGIKISESIKENHSFSVALIDIDQFKQINDEHGHTAGDLALKAFVNNINHLLSENESLYRWGGEEFLIVMPSKESKAGLETAEYLRKEIERHGISFSNNQTTNLTVSIGVATYPDNGLNTQQLVQNADVAMYKAKANGRNRVEVASKKKQ